MSAAYDVIVVGLGGTGSAAAYHLAARGQRVLGVERYGPAHDRGSSHGGSRAIRQAYFEDPAYVPLLVRAYELWERLAHDAGRELITVTGGLVLGGEQSPVITGSKRSAQSCGIAHEMLDAREIRRRFRTMTPARDVVGFYEDTAGVVRPEAGVAAHLQLAHRAGAELRFHEPVTHWDADPYGAGVRVETSDNSYTAARLVICPGAWAPELLACLGLSFQAQRYVQYWFDPVVGTGPYEPGRHPIYVWETGDGRQLWGHPALADGQAGVKVSFLSGGSPCTPWTLDRTVRPAEVEIIRGYLRPRVPTLPGALLHASTCMYTSTPDDHFVLAAHPEHPQVTVACGLSGHGFKFVPVVGEILADLVVDGSSRHPVDMFDPRRLLAPAV